jgi:hypothetical protein
MLDIDYSQEEEVGLSSEGISIQIDLGQILDQGKKKLNFSVDNRFMVNLHTKYISATDCNCAPSFHDDLIFSFKIHKVQ